MPIVIGIDEGTPDVWREPQVEIYEETINYLRLLRGSILRADHPLITDLSKLDPYGKCYIGLDQLPELLEELRIIARKAENRSLPAPPESVGYMEMGEPGDSFGWAGLLEFWQRLTHLCETAIHERKALVAIGD